MNRFFPCIFFISSLFSNPHAAALYKTIRPTQLKELIAFTLAYPETKEALQAKRTIEKILHLSEGSLKDPYDVQQVVEHVVAYLYPSHQLDPLQPVPSLESDLSFTPISKEELLEKEGSIDIAQALLSLDDGASSSEKKQLLTWINCMAYHAKAIAGENPSQEDLVHAINQVLFTESQFRFPSLSEWDDKIDTYTFLSSVLHERQGVCLGVSILYLCIAQRLGLELEIVTPPGHIYLRLPLKRDHLNIETTARGIHVPSEHYLSLIMKSLKLRSQKEVIGLAFFNKASAYWQQKRYDLAEKAYEIALTFLPGDCLTERLYAMMKYNNNRSDAQRYLEQIVAHKDPTLLYQDTMCEDLLHGRVTINEINLCFEKNGTTRESLIKKREDLSSALEHYPLFKEGWFTLAALYLELGQTKEAYTTLLRYNTLESKNPIAHYYTCMLALQQNEYTTAKKHWQLLYELVSPYHEKELREIKRSMQHIFSLSEVTP